MKGAIRTWKRGASPDYIVDCIRNQVWARVEGPPRVTVPSQDVRLSALAASILGDNGVARFTEFWSYEDGWDFGDGKVLSLKSISSLEAFFEQFAEFRRRPSLFLTQSGNLMLGWEDAANNTIELECTPDGYVLFLGATDDEMAFSCDELSPLLEVLSQANANGAP